MFVKIIEVSKDHPLFKQLQQDYEHEFSPITGYIKNTEGLYDQDMLMSHWSKNGHKIYLAFSDKNEPLGFAVVNLSSMITEDVDTRDIAEFYVIPAYRRSHIGKQIAFTIFSMYPGKWEVRQLPGLVVATSFWNKIIAEFSKGMFTQIEMADDHWTGIAQVFTCIPLELNHDRSGVVSLVVFDHLKMPTESTSTSTIEKGR